MVPPLMEDVLHWPGSGRRNGEVYRHMDARIHAYLRIAASQGRETARIGPFHATFSPHSANPYLSYAIPDDDAVPTATDVTALIAAYEARERIPRLEYIARLAPAVEPALIDAGFTVEGRLPLMACVPGAVRPQPLPEGIELVVPMTDAELLATLTAQNEAYGGPPAEPEAAERLRASMAAGQLVILARVAQSGEAVGGGACTTPAQGLTEVAGIGVRTPFRRRGVAAALTARLVQEAFAVGVELAFLMAAGEDEARIYARAGFTRIGDILHISRQGG